MPSELVYPIKWMSLFVNGPGYFLSFLFYLKVKYQFVLCTCVDPDKTSGFATSDLGLHSLHMSSLWNDRH